MEQNGTLGAIMAVISILFYGSCYLPVRWFEAKDGIFFQWFMCTGQLLVAIVMHVIQGCPAFHPLAMLGGAFFAIGNGLTVFIMDGVGMAVGVLLWNTMCCVVGWACSRFGLLGTPQVFPEHNLLNMLGVAFVCVGGVFFAPIKHHPMKVRPAPGQFTDDDEKEEKSSLHAYPTKSHRIASILLCIFVGCLYGNMLTPINYIIAHRGANPNVDTHFFAHASGAFLVSSIIFCIYALYKKNRPFTNPELALPSLLSGFIYGIATYSLLIANQHLSQIVAYPIISKAPGVVTSIWAVLLFKEIKGKWNIIALVTGIFVTLTGVTIISISKIPF